MPLRFVPYDDLGDVPNVVVDGSPTPSTVMTLSHWPGSPTPSELLADTSAEIACRATDGMSRFAGIVAASNNHFDQDGLMGLFAVLEPEQAQARRHRLIDVAAAGDFATFEDRDSMRIAIAITTLADPERSPLPAEVLAGSYATQTAQLYDALLPRVAELLDDPDALRPWWEAEDAELDESIAAIRQGVVRIDEVPALDLAVVTVPEQWARRAVTRFGWQRPAAVHPAAICAATDCLRIATLHGANYRVELRYESWVMFRSRPVMPRPDLRELAARLAALDPAAGWRADPPSALTPVLESVGESALSPRHFRAELETFLASAPAAWDPYAR